MCLSDKRIGVFVALKNGRKNMKKSFETPIVKVIALDKQDVLAAGSGEVEVENEAHWTAFY